MPLPVGSPNPVDPLPTGLHDRLRRLMESPGSHVIVLRSEDRETGTALVRRIVGVRPGPSVIVTSPDGSVLEPPSDLFPDRAEVWFKVQPAADDIASVAVASALLRLVLALMRKEGDDPTVLPQWIPPRLLKAYSALAAEPTPTIAVDGWDELLARDLRNPPGEPARASTPEQRERTALNALEDSAGVHFVIVTRQPRPALEAKADLVLEAAARPGESASRLTLHLIEPSGGSWTVRRPSRDSQLILAYATATSRCRCGGTISVGDPVYTIATHPGLAGTIFHGQPFCSPKCVRAFCLEALETLDSVDTPATKAMVTDLHEFLRSLAGVFAAILEE